MTIWFTSDTHWYHKNILEYCNRPWQTVDEMNEGLIERWNSKVAKDDEVYHLGDFAFTGVTKALDIWRRLNGIKYWIKGNHCPSKTGKRAVEEGLVQWFRDYHFLKVSGHRQADEDGTTIPYTQNIVLCHFPILSWDGMAHGNWHLHGHCHGSLPPTRMMRHDVGVDPNNWYPISYEEIKKMFVWRTVVPVDHHGSEEPKFPKVTSP